MTRPLILLLLTAWIAACAHNATQPDNSAALRDIRSGNSGDEVIVQGTVTKVYPASYGPAGVHERFVVSVTDGSNRVPIFVADNISIAQVAPLHRGDQVIVKGELAFNSYGPLIHWTHHDPRLRHQSGFIEVHGNIYE